MPNGPFRQQLHFACALALVLPLVQVRTVLAEGSNDLAKAAQTIPGNPLLLNRRPEPAPQSYSAPEAVPTSVVPRAAFVPPEAPPPLARWTNPTAPNALVKYLSGDFTDSDGDGLTDAAEMRYGFDPHDPTSFPPELGPITLPSPPIINIPVAPPTALNLSAFLEVGTRTLVNQVGTFTLRFTPPPAGSIALLLKHAGTNLMFQIVNTGHVISPAGYGLGTNDSLAISFSHYGTNGQYQSASGAITQGLAQVPFPVRVLGASSNQLGFTFITNFPPTARTQYLAFLRRVMPLMRRQLGPPAETFNTLFDTNGANGSTFVTLDQGRRVQTDGAFVPRLIVHELIHAWRGAYLMASDANWNYAPDISGFEEGSAEGMALEIVQEYVRSYPNDSVTLQLMNARPYQYWSHKAHVFDSVKNMRVTGGGDFFSDLGGGVFYLRYSAAATAVQLLARQNPEFIRQFHAAYFARIDTNAAWRPNREDLMSMWSALVPQLHGHPLRHVLDSLPVFNGRKLDVGFYIQNEIRPYGASGNFQFAPLYIKGDGYMMWAHHPGELTGTNAIPAWLPTLMSRGYVVVDTQNSPVDIVVRNASDNIVFTNFYHTSADYEPDGWPYGNGWFQPADLRVENFPQGLYRATVTMEQFHDPGAREDHYFFGIQGLNQDRETEYAILVGVDGVNAGTVQLTLQGTNYTAPLVEGAAWFRSPTWPFDLSGECAITVTDPRQRSNTYQRTLLECASLHGYFQQQFIILDRDFDGVEDPYDARLRLAPPQWVNSAARLVATRPAPHGLNINGGIFTLLATTNVAQPLTNWTSLGPAHLLDGKLQWDDAGAATNRHRFYQVVEAP